VRRGWSGGSRGVDAAAPSGLFGFGKERLKMMSATRIDLHVLVTRLRRSGDKEAADAIDRLASDLALSEMANETLEAQNTALAEQIEALIEAARDKEPQ
jgi:hypothetical protein